MMKSETKSFWILTVAELLVLDFLLFFRVASLSPEGFVSIDCGGKGGRDPDTNLDWTSDGDYVQAAAELQKEGVIINASVTLAPRFTPVDNAERLKTALIFFPSDSDRVTRSKFCYKLRVDYKVSEASKSYLLRATFPSRNLTTAANLKDKNGKPISLSAYSTRFYFTVDSTFVSTVDLEDLQPLTIELIISALDRNVYVCLVPLEDRSSMPAISALELRPFSSGMYSRSYDWLNDGTVPPVRTTYLMKFDRCNFGGDPNSSSLRNLTRKGLGGNLPCVFGSLRHLTVLDLSNNRFSGNLPRSLRNITALRALNLERNNLSGEVPTLAPHSLPNLETLSLSTNRLSGNLSSFVSALDDTVSHLNVSNNLLNGSIPLEIEKLTNLQSLDLSNNQLSGELKVNLAKLQRLQTLNLRNNRLKGIIPDNIWSSSSLESVDLRGNMFSELNLTTWYRSVKDAKSSDGNKGRRRAIRLVGHLIEETIPSLASLQELDSFLRPSKDTVSFILLAGNPCCDNHGGGNSETIGWLCRANENDEFRSSLAKEHVKPPFFKYEELKTGTENFSTRNILGKGGFGTVYRAELSDGSVVAVKRLNPTEQNTFDFLKEMVNITGIKHRNLIQLKGCCVREKQQRMLVYEYAENKNLAEALWGPQKPFVLSWKQRFNICLGIARGLTYLNEELQPKMIHRDIKPQNILLDKDYNAKIADFGLVRPSVTDDTQITLNIGGTRGYCSPEYINEGMVSEKLDVYSFGVVLLEIVSGRVCIDFKLQEDKIFLRTLAMELYDEGKLLALVDPELMGRYDEEEVLLVVQTALACCQLDPKMRPTMSQVVNRLMKYADVAIDIVQEHRAPRPDLESILGSDMIANTNEHFHDSEDRCLVSLNSAISSQKSSQSPRACGLAKAN